MADTTKQMTIILRAKDTTGKVFKSFQKTATAAFHKIKLMVAAMATAIIAVGVGAFKKLTDATMNLLKSSIDTAAQFESLEMQFGVLLGSVEKGTAAFEGLWAVAKELPFTIGEIAESAKVMKAWGVTGEDMGETMKALADVSALTGQNMSTMATTIGRAWQQGTFLTRGPGALLRGIMQTKMGIEDISKLSLPEFRKALSELMTDPQFGVAGMAQRLATTFIGIKSMISDAITNIRLTIAKSGLFEEVKNVAGDFLEFLRSNEVINAVTKVGRIASGVVSDFRAKFLNLVASGQMKDLIQQWVRTFVNWSNIAKNIIKNLPAIGQAVMNMVQSIGLALNKFFEMLGTVFEALESLGVGKTVLTETRDLMKEMAVTEKERASLAFKVAKTQKLINDLKKKEAADGDAWAIRQINLWMTQIKRWSAERSILEDRKSAQTDELLRLQKLQWIMSGNLNFQVDMNDLFKGGNELLKDWNKNLESGSRKTLTIVAKTKEELQAMFAFGKEQKLPISEQWDKFISQLQESQRGMVETAAITAKSMQNAFQKLFFDVMNNEFKGMVDFMKNIWRGFTQEISTQLSQLVTKGLGEMINGGGGVSSPSSIMNIALKAAPALAASGGAVGIAGASGAGLGGASIGLAGSNSFTTIINALDSQSVIEAVTKDGVPQAIVGAAQVQGGM